MGDQVLVMFLDQGSKLLSQWQGPYTMVQKVGPVDYEVRCPEHKKELQRFHINLLKKWKDQEGWLMAPYPHLLDLGPSEEQKTLRRKDTHVPMGEHLTKEQQEQLREPVQAFDDVFCSD